MVQQDTAPHRTEPKNIWVRGIPELFTYNYDISNYLTVQHSVS